MALTRPKTQIFRGADYEDGERFLEQVKTELANKPGDIATFKQLLTDFKYDRVEGDTVLSGVKEILQGHKKLIIGFNTFLLEEYRFRVDEDDHLPHVAVNQMQMLTHPKKQIFGGADYEDGQRFLEEVKTDLANKPGDIAIFKQLLTDFKYDRVEGDTVLLGVKEILQGHKKLITGFNTFLLEEYRFRVDEDDDLPDAAVNHATRQILRLNFEEPREACMSVFATNNI